MFRKTFGFFLRIQHIKLGIKLYFKMEAKWKIGTDFCLGDSTLLPFARVADTKLEALQWLLGVETICELLYPHGYNVLPASLIPLESLPLNPLAQLAATHPSAR